MLQICTAAPSTEYCVYGLNNDYVPCDRNVLTSRDFPGLCTVNMSGCIRLLQTMNRGMDSEHFLNL